MEPAPLTVSAKPLTDSVSDLSFKASKSTLEINCCSTGSKDGTQRFELCWTDCFNIYRRNTKFKPCQIITHHYFLLMFQVCLINFRLSRRINGRPFAEMENRSSTAWITGRKSNVQHDEIFCRPNIERESPLDFVHITDIDNVLYS